jgi:trk system potassium uptake protein TrkA
MKKAYAVIGLGRFGYSIAKTLADNKCEVIAIDRDEERVKKLSEFVTHAVQLEAMDEKSLRSVGIQNVDVAVVSIGENIEASILVVMILREMGVKKIIAKAVTRLHGKVLENIGVDKVVYPERDMAIRVAHSLIRPNMVDQLELSPEYSIIEAPAPSELSGKSLKESQLRATYGANLIAIKKIIMEGDLKKEIWNVNPLPTDVISKGDLLVLIGRNEDLEKFMGLE